MRIKLFSSLLLSMGVFMLPTVSLASVTIAAASMVNLTGATASARLGAAVASGDFNGDGYADIVSGAPNSSSYIAIMYGSATTLSSVTMSSSNTAILSSGSATDAFGAHLAVGDINNDGYDDIIVGAAGDATGGANAGIVYLIYGKAAAYASETVSSDSTIAAFIGSGGFNAGAAVASGDINADGYDDIAIGMTGDATGVVNGGSVIVVYGASAQFSGGHSLNAPGTYGKFTGEIPDDAIGSTLAVGDINSDSYADVIVGVPANDESAVNAGALYVVYGQSTKFLTNISIGSSAEITGETAGDGAGTVVAVSTTSVNGDAYNDIITNAPNNADGATGAGAIYVIPGSATAYTGTSSLGGSTILEFTGVTGGDAVGNSISSSDLNQDGYGDIIVGATTVSTSTGAVYVVPGSATLAGASLSTATTFNGTSASDYFGRSVSAGDLNGDGFPELLIGARGYTGGANTGAVYVGYLYIDADGDGVPGTTGLLGSSDTTVTYDCSDTDATVSANQTYYVDSDADGLGDPVATTTSVCSATAPTGYVSNSSDTNDTIPNNGVEIGGDAVDNDGDSLIDEVNTVAENGAHPYYSLQDVTSKAAATANITNVVGIAGGMIEVTYADSSVYDYPVYTSTSTKVTDVEQYQSKGYGIVLHKKGKKVYLVNLYTGGITDKVTIKKAGFTSSAMLLKDLRSNNKDEVVVTGKTKAKVTLTVVKVSSANGTLTKSDAQKVTDKKVSVTKTRATSTKIKLRSAKSKTLEVFNVTKAYTLQLI